MDTGATPAVSFGEEHFGQAPLGHRRRLRRLVFTADRIAAHPGGTLPDKLRDPAAYQGLMRLARHPCVTHEAVLHTHRQRPLDRLRQLPGVALLIHDSPERNYTGKQSLTGLGQLGNGSSRGYVCHNSLAFDPRTRQVLGLAHQLLHRRDDVPAGESDQAQRERETRESLLWVRACAAIGPAPAGRTWVDVADRGADTFEFLDSEVAAGRTFVVRSHHDRSLDAGPGGRGPAGTLHALARGLPEWYRRTVTVGARDGRPARTATVAVAAAAVRVRPPTKPRGKHRGAPLALGVVVVREVDPPAGVEPVAWILLTNTAVATAAEAETVVTWYESRWVIEEYHKAQKTGCAIEAPQFTREGRLQPVIALLSVVAVLLLNLRGYARQPGAETQPARAVVPEAHVAVLSVWRYRERRPELTVREFFLALARLGGHQNRRRDGPPGWLVLWRGWAKLQDMVDYAVAAGVEHLAPREWENSD
jgi:Transposase DNA-binding